ncbi:MAG: DUF1761 domain-containing protein [Bacteroidia bacterium]
MNFLILLLAALVPLLIGFIWYNPKVLGTAWMNASGLTEEKLKGSNMIVIFGLTYLFSLMASTVISYIVIHQSGIYSTLASEEGFGVPGSAIQTYIDDFMKNYGQNFRTFKHGMLHGAVTAIFFVLPIIGINALFERRGFKYIMIHVGYWFISLMLMGGIICQFS